MTFKGIFLGFEGCELIVVFGLFMDREGSMVFIGEDTNGEEEVWLVLIKSSDNFETLLLNLILLS